VNSGQAFIRFVVRILGKKRLRGYRVGPGCTDAPYWKSPQTDKDGSTIGQRVTAAGYQWSFTGKNIAAGYTTPQAVVNGWINSPGHRANMLNPNYQEIGIGYHYLSNDTGQVNYYHYWTQNFGKPL
jgi:hypothetical protein